MLPIVILGEEKTGHELIEWAEFYFHVATRLFDNFKNVLAFSAREAPTAKSPGVIKVSNRQRHKIQIRVTKFLS